MPYAKSTWVNNSAPDIDATHLNNIEDGVSKAPYGPDGAANFVPVGDGSGGWLYQTITNAQINAAAAIAYSKLNLATSIVNADISAGAAIALSKLASDPTGKALGLTGATAATRYAGATAGGAPASGTFALGDFVIDQTGKVFVCTVAGSPGTWVQVGAAGATTYRKTTATTVNNTAVETDLLNGEITVGASVLTATGALRLTTVIDALNNSGSNVTYRFKLKLGVTTVFDSGAIGVGSGAVRGPINFEAFAMNRGATNSQAWRGSIGMTNTNSAFGSGTTFTTGEGSIPTTVAQGAIPAPWVNTSAVDMTSSQALTLTITMGTANALAEVKLSSALVEIV